MLRSRCSCELGLEQEFIEPRVGRLHVAEPDQPALVRKITSGGNWRTPGPGGELPAFAGIDREMIAGLIAECRPEGSRYTGEAWAMAGYGNVRVRVGATVRRTQADRTNRRTATRRPEFDRAPREPVIHRV